jgi:hypothetical protein
MKTLTFYICIISVFTLSCSGDFKSSSNNKQTIVSIEGEKFFINGEPTYKGRQWQGYPIEGLLMNSRMVQGIFDDLNPETVDNWKYPDTQKWDADRNTNEFVAAMDEWYEKGLLAFTMNLQGGSPLGYGNKGWINSAIDPKGELRPDYMTRLKKILDRANEKGMVVILGIFYFGQDQHLEDEAAVYKGVDNTINWLFENEYRNVIIEVVNETSEKGYDHAILRADRIHEMIDYIKSKEKNGYRYLVSTSYKGAVIPEEAVVKSSDYILLHGNGVDDPAHIAEMVRQSKAVDGYRPMPIVFNEDDHFDFDKPSNNFVEAVKAYASWGYFDFRAVKGLRGSEIDEPFEYGFQSVPIDWRISSSRKKAFFDKLEEITGGFQD